MSGVTKDATSGIYTPATLAEWTTTMAAAGISSGNPSLLWLLQEASGSVADSIGTFTGTAGGTGATYANAVTGWSRKGVGTTGDNQTAFWNNNSASLPSLATQSQLALVYAIVTSAPAANRDLFHMANTTVIAGGITSANHPRIAAGATTAIGTSDAHGVVKPWVLKHDHTNSAQVLYTDTEKLPVTFTALSGQVFRVGGGAATAPAAVWLYACSFFLGAAELTDAQVKKLLQTLGWTVAWT